MGGWGGAWGGAGRGGVGHGLVMGGGGAWGGAGGGWEGEVGHGVVLGGEGYGARWSMGQGGMGWEHGCVRQGAAQFCNQHIF